MIRGEVYLADLGDPVAHEQGLRRPVLLVSAQPWLESNPPVITVIPVTRTRRQQPTHVEVEPGSSGLHETSYVKCEDIRSISPRRLEHRFGEVDRITMTKVEAILRRILGL